jgi:FtsP/CotA-like multicopper oxidase with cupredoxin domain
VNRVEKLTRDDSYRLRIVSISCEPAFTFSIDGHQLTIIEADSNNVRPLLVDSLEIFPGKQIQGRFPHVDYDECLKQVNAIRLL